MTQPAPVCIATATAACRLIIRPTTAGHPVAWPMLVADPCPFTKPAAVTFHGQDNGHAHVHYMTDPGPPWLRHAPCNRRLYLLTIEPRPVVDAPQSSWSDSVRDDGGIPQPAVGPARPVTGPLPPAPAIRPQPTARRYGPPDAITALMLAGRKVTWNWVTSWHTLDGQPVTADGLEAAAAQLPPPARGWAIDPRATGRCPSCTGRSADGLCLKCRWAAALTTASPPA